MPILNSRRRAVRLQCQSALGLALKPLGWRRARLSRVADIRTVSLAEAQHRPGHSSVFVSQRYGRDVVAAPGLKAL